MGTPSVFICYRRSDTAAVAGRIRDRLGSENVFLDVHAKQPGRFRDAIREALGQARFVLVLIGPDWEQVKRADGSQRLAHRDDHVRFEIETALGSQATLIPVLVDRPAMPPEHLVPPELLPLFEFNGVHLRTDTFDADFSGLARMLAGLKRGRRLALGVAASVFALAAIGAAWYVGSDWIRPSEPEPTPSPAALGPLHLRFDLLPSDGSPDSAAPEVLEYRQIAPTRILKQHGERERLARQASGHFLFKVARSDVPGPQHTYFAKLSRPEGAPSLGPPRDPTELCFEATSALGGLEDLELDCVEHKGCVPRSEHAISCEAQATAWRLPALVGSAHAAPASAQPGWRVPSLRSLRETPPEDRPGYTLFEVETGPFAGFPEVRFMTLEVRINGTPIYVDGLEAAELPIPVEKAVPTTVALGIPNLNFRGMQYGWDDLSLRFELFDESGKSLGADSATLSYAPLRDLPEQRTTLFGSETVVAGTYHVPADEDRYTVLVLSAPVPDKPCPPQPNEALRRDIDHAVDRIDRAGLELDGAEVISVVRPPRWRADLGRWNCSFGVALGVVQESQQIRLTYDRETARRVCRLAIEARRDGVRVIDAAPYIRDFGANRNLSCS